MNFQINDVFSKYTYLGSKPHIITRQTEKTIFFKPCIISKSETYFKGAPQALHYKDDYENYVSYLPIPDAEKKEEKILKKNFEIDKYIHDIENKVFKNDTVIENLHPDTCDELNNSEITKKEYYIQSKLNYFKLFVKPKHTKKFDYIKIEELKKELNELYESNKNEFIGLLNKIDLRDGNTFINHKWEKVYYYNLFFEIISEDVSDA